MENLNLVIGSKLKALRNNRSLSLDEVSKMTGVSKPMLGQIERGISNPTVTTLWKIATGLKVYFSYFVEEEKQELKVINIEAMTPVLEEENKMKLYQIYPFDVNNGFEIFTIELDSGCSHHSLPHTEGVEEYVIVTEGEIEIGIDGANFSLKKGCSIKFMSNVPHQYDNKKRDKAVFQNVIVYHK